MALLFLEGFEGYNNVDEMFNVQGPVSWMAVQKSNPSSNPVINSTIIRTSQVTPANSRSLFLDVLFTDEWGHEMILGLGGYSTVIMGFAVHTSNYNGSAPILRLGETSGASQGICLGRDSSNRLTVSIPNGSGQPGTTLGTSTNSLNVNNSTYIEIRVVRHSTLGSLEVRIDDPTEINLNGINTSTNITGGYTRAYFSHNGRYTTTGR